MFVEIFRLIIVIGSTAGGYKVADARFASDSPWLVVGALIGACIGYVVGGVLGRTIFRGFLSLEQTVARAPASAVLVGGLGAVVGGLAGAGLSMPVYFALPWVWAYPASVLLMWVFGTLFYRIGQSKSEELLALAGLSTRPLVRASPYGTGQEETHLVDTSAAIDGRLLDVVRAGFLRGALLVAPFVIDELQGIADQADPGRRRRGRRGLESLEALTRERGTSVHVLDDEVPEFQDVDAKLVSLARRLHCDIVTTDFNLQRVAEVQGVSVLNLNNLADVLRPSFVAGDLVRVQLERPGKEPKQAVGYLEDGTMVVVEDGAHLIGTDAEVKVGTVHQTAVGRMIFATPASPSEARRPA